MNAGQAHAPHVPAEGDKRQCPRCDGCGQLANSDDQEPWTYWLALPLGAALAVTRGIVQPENCFVCHGLGQQVLSWIPDPSVNPKRLRGVLATEAS